MIIPALKEAKAAEKIDVYLNGNKYSVQVHELRVDIGFSITFHKVQGSTIKRIILDLNETPGRTVKHLDYQSAYVGVSRVRNGADMRLLPLQPGFFANSELGLDHLKKLMPPRELVAFLKGYDPASGQAMAWNPLLAAAAWRDMRQSLSSASNARVRRKTPSQATTVPVPARVGPGGQAISAPTGTGTTTGTTTGTNTGTTSGKGKSNSQAPGPVPPRRGTGAAPPTRATSLNAAAVRIPNGSRPRSNLHLVSGPRAGPLSNLPRARREVDDATTREQQLSLIRIHKRGVYVSSLFGISEDRMNYLQTSVLMKILDANYINPTAAVPLPADRVCRSLDPIQIFSITGSQYLNSAVIDLFFSLVVRGSSRILHNELSVESAQPAQASVSLRTSESSLPALARSVPTTAAAAAAVIPSARPPITGTRRKCFTVDALFTIVLPNGGWSERANPELASILLKGFNDRITVDYLGQLEGGSPVSSDTPVATTPGTAILMCAHLSSGHYVLVIVDHPTRQLILCDPLGPRSARMPGERTDVLTSVQMWLHDRRSSFGLPVMQDYSIIYPKDLPRQSDGNSCGPFVCFYAYFFAMHGRLPKNTDANGGDSFNLRLAVLHVCMTGDEEGLTYLPLYQNSLWLAQNPLQAATSKSADSSSPPLPTASSSATSTSTASAGATAAAPGGDAGSSGGPIIMSIDLTPTTAERDFRRALRHKRRLAEKAAALVASAAAPAPSSGAVTTRRTGAGRSHGHIRVRGRDLRFG